MEHVSEVENPCLGDTSVRSSVPRSFLRLGISGTLAMPSSQAQPSDQPTNDHSSDRLLARPLQAEPNSALPSPSDNGQFPAPARSGISDIPTVSLSLYNSEST